MPALMVDKCRGKARIENNLLPLSGSRVMADALVSDQEIAILCDVLEGWGANLNANKRRVLDQLIAKDLSCPLTKSRLQNINLPPKLNNFSPNAALD
jgi:hypothetical protein